MNNESDKFDGLLDTYREMVGDGACRECPHAGG